MTKELNPEKIGFFDPEYEDNGPAVNTEKNHVLSGYVCVCGLSQRYGANPGGKKAVNSYTAILLRVCSHLAFNKTIENEEVVILISQLICLI